MSSRFILFLVAAFSLQAAAKTFQNSYVSFEVPNDWTCTQEGISWTCSPQAVAASKDALILVSCKVAGPEDNLTNFKNFLSQPRNIPSKVGTPMPSRVLYAQERVLDNTHWIQAQHLGSEVQDYYTLYLATVKAQLAILVSFHADKDRYQQYNPIFEHAMRTLKIVATQEYLFPKKAGAKGGSDGFAIQPVVPGKAMNAEDLMPPPERPRARGFGPVHLLGLLVILGIGMALYFSRRRNKSSPRKRTKPPGKP
jgi:hypothetical protein